MPQTVPIALNPGSRWDRFTVGVLDSAASHDRSLAVVAGLVLTNAVAINAAAVNNNRNPPPGNFTVMFGNLRAMFRPPHAHEAAQWNVVLFHVDMNRLDKSQQMMARFRRDDNKGGGFGGGSNSAAKA